MVDHWWILMHYGWLLIICWKSWIIHHPLTTSKLSIIINLSKPWIILWSINLPLLNHVYFTAITKTTCCYCNHYGIRYLAQHLKKLEAIWSSPFAKFCKDVLSFCFCPNLIMNTLRISWGEGLQFRSRPTWIPQAMVFLFVGKWWELWLSNGRLMVI